MGSPKSEQQIQAIIDPILGYLNFGSGAFDARFFVNLNDLFGRVMEARSASSDSPASDGSDGQPDRVCEAVTPSRFENAAEETGVAAAQVPDFGFRGTTAASLLDWLFDRQDTIRQENAAFRDTSQARTAIELTSQQIIPAYLEFHRDLFFHQSTEFLLNSFFIGRVFELVLQQFQRDGADSPEGLLAIDRPLFTKRVLARLNDFIGHRPVATLESQKLEPYQHEFFRPLPVYIDGAGVACGRYQPLIFQALKILSVTNPHILRSAQFAPERLSELAIDPRAFDFDHPINQRPNHHFGQWDEQTIDGDGFYRRFILHQVTLEALLERVEECSRGDHAISHEEALIEAASALACTMLMGSGISGDGPGAHDSNTTLASLIPNIASYRDQFYDELLATLDAAHRDRLIEEATIRHQPFGAVRQDLNARLSHRRATQLVNCRLAAIFARMGYPEAAEHQSRIVPVASARFNCEMDCLLSAANAAVDDRDLPVAFDFAKQVMLRLKQGIDCGAVVDPWNMLGFDGNYSLFPAMENTVRDHRVFDLLDIMDRLFALLSRITSEAAAVDQVDMLSQAESEFHFVVEWWRKYAGHEVSAVDAVDPEDLYDAATIVSQALNLWYKGGAAAGDIEFWKPHAELLDSPKAYSLVIDALMQREDYQTASALLIHWISQSEAVSLEHGDSSFHNLMFRWIVEQKSLLHQAAESDSELRDEVWMRIRKFHDFLEVNAGEYWMVPEFELGQDSEAIARRLANSERDYPEDFEDLDEFDEFDDEDDDEENLYGAAFEETTFEDSADDGIEGEIHDGGDRFDHDDLEAEVDRILDRLEFLGTLAAYWNVAAKIPLPQLGGAEMDEAVRKRLIHRRSFLTGWVHQAARNRDGLVSLLDAIGRYSLAINGSDRDAMVEYDQRRLNKDMLLEHTINTCIETENAIRMLVAVVRAIDYLVDGKPLQRDSEQPADEASARIDAVVNGGAPVVCVYAAVLLNDPQLVERLFGSLIEHLQTQTPLYVPLSKGGPPAAIVNARVVQTSILELLRRLPAAGLFQQTFEMTQTALDMERNNPVGGGAVTEFDEIFEVAYSSMVETLVRSTALLRDQRAAAGEMSTAEIKKESQRVLFDCIEMLTESMLPLWLDHSKTLRLSVLEKVRKPGVWDKLVEFIRKYGDGLFTQSFFHLGNVRAILHQGVDSWLQQVVDSPGTPDLRMFDELGTELNRETAVRFLTIVLESIRENFNEYVDYNTTTTQSDHGNALDSFLDFLRLRARYDRICWHLKPVVWAHRILVNEQESGVARMWRRSLTERVGPEADKYLTLLEQLRQKYSIQMASVGRRLEGRFGHQLQIDRLRALVAPAMARPQNRDSDRAFELLQHESQAFLRSTNGVGVDLPEWLAELENEVHQFLLPRRLRDFWHEPATIETVPLPIAQLREKIEQLPRKN